ncbi:histone-lysine N-methyltransferase TRX1 [Selaginella moellendorffii]|uniref:histone-lysine N-methyltransferase TRX1 n=1 Tax=Selaginella moellendorffii TaxID=88036 RepID=UPI000D1D046A|nr:histone-lysine N-methyltransferase TRX1 [Selaginella moellendorffii]|eukprot:XP_024542933.1 histone-lysine N-methyltransferase TRX1 [Selaginella moellendorffii]
MGGHSATFVEVPLLGHDKEEGVILQPCTRQSTLKRCAVKSKASQVQGMGNEKRKFESDEKENSVAARKKLKASKGKTMELKFVGTGKQEGEVASSRRKRKNSQKATSSQDDEDSDYGGGPQKMMELQSLQDKKNASEELSTTVAPKRATRKQKRVQLKQLVSSTDFLREGVVKEADGCETRSGSEDRQDAQAKSQATTSEVSTPGHKAKHKSVKFLLSSTIETDHVWGASKTPELQQNEEEWRAINLDAVNPMELIGRSCKVFWPLDSRWYTGAIHEYNPASKKHRIDYVDNQMEWLCLRNEKVHFQMGIKEEKVLCAAGCDDYKMRLGVDELALLANEMESFEEQISHGTVVWAKVKGWPMWPALVLDEEHAEKCGLERPLKKSTFAVQFFGSCDFARLNNDKIVTFSKGVQLKYHSKCKRPAFDQGLREVESYLKQGRLPEKMAQMLEIQSKSRNDVGKASKTSDAEEYIDDEREHPTKTRMEDLMGYPLDLGSLKILSLGEVAFDSAHFHNKHYIWPVGFSSVRVLPFFKDLEKLVEHRMEVTRCKSDPAIPVFHVTVADTISFEGSTPGDCWKKVYKELDRLKEKPAKTHFKRLSGASMFGFNNPRVFKLIKELPNARECSNFMDWDKVHSSKKSKQTGPSGYKPINVMWKHLERCNVCYLDEEYEGNLLLQCAKCRLMIHMSCYGEQDLPSDGFWLCQLCKRNTTQLPLCCLCPVAGGAMKKTTDGRWAHLTCAMWIPETCLVDVKKMEPIDGVSTIHKERWKLTCSVCRVSHGACIQCSHHQCMTSYHPLCARAAGFSMEIQDDDGDGLEKPLKLLSFCSKHNNRASSHVDVHLSSQESEVAENSSGCSRCEPYNPVSRRRRQEPEGKALSTSKRSFVEKTPYLVANFERKAKLVKIGKAYKSVFGTVGQGSFLSDRSTEEPVLSMSARLESMRSTMHDRLTFGKSGIHGWGVFAKQIHKAGDMMAEYAGEIVRSNIADIREQRHYDSLVGAGTYMFRIDDERVVDATHVGSMAHLINHSCEPNCYSRIITVDAKDSIIIFAKRDIHPWEELTYDYRFASKGAELVCNCGALKCRGSVRHSDDSNNEGRILALRSSLRSWTPL